MKILLLSYYFPPDLSAGAFRAKALADALVRQGGNVQVDVLTTEPNRYRSYQPVPPDDSVQDYRVTRVGLPRERWGFVGQVRSFAAFAQAAASQAPEDHYDIVVATSSRLMTAALGARLAKRKGAVYYLDIRDIFIDTIQHVFHPALVMPLKALLSGIERYAIRRAERVNLVSPGFLPYFREIDATKSYRLFTNGIDDGDRLNRLASGPVAGNTIQILYAGNIGHGQGLDHILPELAHRLGERASFTVIGDGATRSLLVEKCRDIGAGVQFVEPVPRDQLWSHFDQADVLFLHLNDLPAFLKVLPSKLFEYAATGKPILAGVAGYSQQFLTEQLEGVSIFQPGDVDGAVQALEELELAHYPRRAFLQRYARQKIMDEMARDILAAGGVDVS